MLDKQQNVEQSEATRPRITKLALFLAFSRISLSSFGGALYWSRRELVDRLRWISDREFVELLTLGQLLPGPNVLNLTVMVGNRLGGLAGVAVSVAGYLGWPVLVVIAMGIFYQHYGTVPQVQQALAGMSKVAAGLLLATVVKLAMVLPRQWRPWLFGVLAFVAVGVMRWPLLWVIAALGPCAVFLSWKAKD
jgi:chromate transporter